MADFSQAIAFKRAVVSCVFLTTALARSVERHLHERYLSEEERERERETERQRDRETERQREKGERERREREREMALLATYPDLT
jgi:hypothetical protein